MPQRFIPPFTRNKDLMNRATKRLERTEQERTGGGVHAVRRVSAFYPVYLEAGGRRDRPSHAFIAPLLYTTDHAIGRGIVPSILTTRFSRAGGVVSYS